MRNRVIIAVIVAVVLFLAGFWPQRQRAVAAERDVASLRTQVSELEARNRGAGLLADVLSVEDAVARKDYGLARQLASTFFDRVRAEAADSPLPELRSSLVPVLAARDSVIGALAQVDDQVEIKLQEVQRQLRTALGYRTR